MKKIGSITPIWNQELFVKPHFDMLKRGVDRSIVLVQSGPLPSYKNEHGYSTKADTTQFVLEEYFPNVEVYNSEYPIQMDFRGELYNEGLSMMEECDIVLRLDPDMLFTDRDFDQFVEFVQNNDAEAYRMDFRSDSINYYMTGDFDHGLKDAQEDDALAVSPKKRFTGILDYTGESRVIKIENWMCHHFRGWNKPKSTPSNWAKDIVQEEYVKEFWDKNNKCWYKAPKEIKKKMKKWLKELEQIKEDFKI